MNVAPISSPLPGEHLAETSPEMRVETDSTWRQRLNFWPGRALTADAFEIEQEHRAGHLAWQGRVATPGIVTGLEVGMERSIPTGTALTMDGHFIHVLPGHGFTVYGEDVTIPRPLRIALDQIPVRYVRFRPPGDGPPAEPAPGGTTRSTPLEFGGVRLELDDFGTGHIPWAAVLVARPAEFGAFGKVDPADPCELDPTRDAFADERRLDAATFWLFQLPVAWESDPLLVDREDPRWRNRLAHVVFREETSGSSRQYLRFRGSQPAGSRWDTQLEEEMVFPWELFGVPLALLSSELVTVGDRRFFLDRASVTRPGGRARARSRTALIFVEDAAPPPPGAGTPALWRARVDQFAEHLSSLAESAAAEQARHFQFLPPAGLLPRNALNFLTTEEAIVLPPSAPGQPPDRAAMSSFFPAIFAVETVPIPTEDLDAALASSAALEPFDLAPSQLNGVRVPELVRVLVPLAQRVFDPELLVVEVEDPFFSAEVARLIAVRQDWRQRRDFVRKMRDLWQTYVSGPQLLSAVPALEPDQLEPEPTESPEQLGGGAVALYCSPTDTSGPWEISANFDPDPGVVIELTATTVLFVRLRLDVERPPSRIVFRWRLGAEELTHTWTAPSDAQLERFGPGRAPLAMNLWRLYTVTAADLGLRTGVLTAFTLHLEDGRVGLIDVGKLLAQDRPEPNRIAWWNAQDDTTSVTFIGGEWMRVTGSQLSAPFEQTYEPTFSDKPFDGRLAELPKLTLIKNKPAQSAAEIGLVNFVEALEQQLNRADDFVDLAFLKTQANTHRIRQVLLGDEVADDLLISPILSSVVKRTSARVAEEDLVEALRRTPASAAPSDETRAPGGARAAASDAGITFGTVPGLNVNIARKQAAVARIPTKGDTVALKRAATVDEVRQADPAIGKGFELRTLTIAKRFDAGPVLNAYDYADEGLREVIARLEDLDLGFDDDDFIPDATTGENNRRVTFREVAEGKVTLKAIKFAEAISNDERASGAQRDTGSFLARGVRRADATALILRRLEFYIARRRLALTRAREVLAEFRRQIAAAEARLRAIAGPLAEARHDVSVARALRQEERERIAAINARRDTLIRDEVKFLAYVRPRAVDPINRNVPGWKLDSAGTLAPVPACLQRHDQPPGALRAYVQLFRHAPARWFTDIAPRLRELDTRENLVELLAATQRSALVFATERRVPFATNVTAVAERSALLSAFSIVEVSRTLAAGIQTERPDLRSWDDFRREVEQHSSLGDIIGGRHGHPVLARAAAGVLDQIESVATCLHAEFATVPPAIRLAWVERYSQFDRPAPLNDLTALPRYGSLDRATRRRFQAFADWLFQRVNTAERDAFNLINDLVRICLLLASHAPVKSLIAGHLPRPVPVRPGTIIPVRAFDPRLVRVGMEVHVWQAEKVVARARVEDLQDDEVSARVERVQATTNVLDQTMRVQFVAPAFGFAVQLAQP